MAAANPDLDVLVLHPGVVRTDLGARPGVLGWLLSLVKRAWEAPGTCAARVADILEQDRWSDRGRASSMMQREVEEWLGPADDPDVRASVAEITARLLEEHDGEGV